MERMAFNRQETCALLGVSVTTLWRWEARGLIRPVAHLRHKVYPKSEIERFLKQSTTTG